jgi:predicted nucleotidyltransferase
MENESTPTLPTKEELQAELVSVPEPPEPPEPINEPAYEDNVALALRHARGRRGGDLVSVFLVGSGARRAVTAHSDIDLIALVKGQADGHEIVRVADRMADIRYRGHKEMEEDLAYSPRLPSLLRKARILHDHDGIGAKLIERANHRFRQGPQPASMNEQIRLKAECFHWLGKARRPGWHHTLRFRCRIRGFRLDYRLNEAVDRSTRMENERTEELEAPELLIGALYLGGLLTLIVWLAA